MHASINPNQRLRYSLDSIQVTSAKLGNLSQTFPTRTYDTSLPLPTAATARDSFSISTAVSVVGVNTALFDAALPALAGMQVLAGTTIQPTNVFDGLLNPGWIPAAGGTDTALDTVTFSTDPGWRTGEAVRVIASVGAPANGLVSYSPAAPTTDNALTATVYARRLSSTQFCFNTTEAGALAAATPIDITDAIPTDGTFSFTGGSSDLSFFAQTPLNSLATPSSTDTTTDKVTFDATPLFRTGDAVRVTTIGGGLSPSTTYYIRIDGNQACFYTSAAAALNQVAANPFNLTGNVAGELYLYNRLQFAKSHRWTTGTIIRQGTSGTNLFVRQIDANSITLHANAADAATGANPRVQTSAAGFPITPVFNMFCVDRDRQINSRTYNAQIFSSYSTSQFPDTTLMPKDAFAVHDQAMPASSSLTISSTNTSTRVLTLNSHGLVTGTAVQLATTDASGLSTGVDYFVRELTANTFSLHATRADAEGGGSNALPLAGTVTSKIFPSLSIRFANAGTANAVGDAGRAGTVWSTGTRVQIKASAGGLQANTDYYVRYLGKQLFSFHTSRADAVAGNNPLRITSALDSTNQFQVPERFVECTENLDAVNWLLNTDILNQLSNPVSPVSFTATTLSFTNHSLSNGDRFRVTAATGDLVPGRDYFFRKIDSNTVAVHDTFAAATATTETTAARLTVTDGTGNLLAQIQTCFVWYDVEEAIWSLIEDYSAGFGYGNGTNATGIQRVQEILAMVGAVVPLGDATVSYVPGRGEQLVLITSPYEVDGSGNKFVSAQTMAIQVPVDTIEGYIISNFSTDTFSYSVGATLSGNVFCDCDNDGIQTVDSTPIADVTITLTGTDQLGNAVSLITTTAADGSYLFIGLSPGTYTVSQTQPTGYLDGIDTAGSEGGAAGNDVISNITIGDGVNATEYNFAELHPSSVAGTVYVDSDNDGVVDAGETRLAGVTVKLAGTDDRGQSVSQTATTDANGEYLFDNLRPGTYVLTQTQPADYLDGLETLGTAGGTAGADQFSITIEACTTATGYNFGELVAGSLAGRVFEECDNDGVFNGDAAGLTGVTVTLTGIDDLGNSVSTSMTTDADGRYQFSNLRPGTYTVTETQPAGYLDGTDTAGSEGGSVSDDAISSIVLPGGVDATGYDFAELDPSSLAGVVYVDSNNDGVVDGGETRLAGVTVTLIGTDDRGQSVSQTVTTDANGEYLFDNLRPGTYVLTQTQPADYLDGLETLGTAGGTVSDDQFSITLDACTTGTDYNFGELAASSLSGRVFEECDNDGVFNGDAAGLAGVTVTLTGIDDLGNSVSTSMTTDADGRYQFSNLRPGTYTVTETQPAGYLDGTDTVGSEGGTVSNDSISAIGLGVGVNATGYDFAELDPSSLAGVVYVDSNNDGVVDAGETRLAGVTVTLTGTDDRGLSVSQTATTDANGEYLFDNLRPGTYTLTETQPAGYSDGQETLGSAGGTVGNDQFTLTLNPCTAGSGYNFGERENANLLAVGDTATIGFWANKNGQAILRSLNGGPSSTLLAQWLVGNFPNLYGAGTGTRSMLLSGGAFKTNDQVATTYIDAFFKPKATVKLEAQILSAAFATYVTNSGLAGTSNIASRYGFTVSATGTGAKLFSVGSNGAALGVADGTMLSIYDMLVRVNSFAVNGVLYAGNTTLRTKANLLFTAINETGDII